MNQPSKPISYSRVPQTMISITSQEIASCLVKTKIPTYHIRNNMTLVYNIPKYTISVQDLQYNVFKINFNIILQFKPWFFPTDAFSATFYNEVLYVFQLSRPLTLAGQLTK